MDIAWLNSAILALLNHVADKLSKGNITIYWVGKNLIRIDMKIEEEVKEVWH